MKIEAHYINLQHRKDRLVNVSKQIASSSVLSALSPKRFDAFSPASCVRPMCFSQTDGYWASRLSHMKLLELGILANLDILLIIEDDIKIDELDPLGIRPSFDDTYNYVMPRLPDNWYGVQFGGYHVSPPSQIAPGIVRLWRFFECPLAVYSRAGMRYVFDEISAMPHQVFDWALMELYHREPRFFAPEMLPVSQITSWSDNEERINH